VCADPAPAQRAADLAAIFADRAAFRAWYEDAVVRVYRYLYPRCGGDTGLAEEITQQTFISALEHRSSYEGRSSPVTWLCTIARNKLADHYRAIDRAERRHLRLLVREIPMTERETYSSIEDRQVLIDALRSLPALQRAAAVLCYVDGLSVREAAAILQRSESATESLLSRARQGLREVLRDDVNG
jgi:RNA polymerase sigma factor (sigma-70 family)